MTVGVVGRVRRLRCYPVKSMAGAELQAARVDAAGLVGDRGWAVVDSAGAPVTARQAPGLGDLAPTVTVSGDVEVDLGALRRLTGRDVHLEHAAAGHRMVAAVHLVSRQAMLAGSPDPACGIEDPRANIELDLEQTTVGSATSGESERSWLGRQLALGTAVLRLTELPRHCLGVYADVVTPGTVSIGDDVRVLA